jgi:hypothetical protein
MDDFSEEFLKRTIEVWQPYCSKTLSLEDAREIAVNMVGLFSLLHELEQKYEEKEKKPKPESCPA